MKLYPIVDFDILQVGDIVLTTPLLKILRQNFPDAEINYCTKKSNADLIRYNPAINKVLEVSDDMDFAELRLLKKVLKKEKYDLVIDLHNNLRTFYLKIFLRLNSKVLVFKKYSFRKFLLVHFKINFMKDLPQISGRYINTLQNIIDTSKPCILSPEIYTYDYSREQADKLFTSLNVPNNSKLVCIVPSSKHFTKTYPPDNYIELINKFDKNEYKFILAGKGEDKTNIEKIKSKTGGNVFDLCDKLSSLELYEIIKKCDLVISGDTGPMHIAEAGGVPIIMLAGSSVKEFGFYPIESSPPAPLLLQRRGEKNMVLEINELSCRPCSHIGGDSCPKGHFKCMKDITPEKIFGTVEQLFQ